MTNLQDIAVTGLEVAVHPSRQEAGGSRVNEGQDRIRDSYRDSYRENYDRLADAKREYDPANLFRVNQNIEPQGGER